MKLFLESDRYKNQFETNTSGGTLSHFKRNEWEDNLFANKYRDKDPRAKVKYGVLNIVNDPKGM